MSCLCHKLRTSQYHNIDKTEVKPGDPKLMERSLIYMETQILKRALAEAPDLFQADLRHPSKKKRTASDAASPSSAELTYISLPDSPDRPIVSSSVARLVQTYFCPNTVTALDESGCDIQQANGDRSVELFLAIERVDRNIEIQQLYRRICCYEFAQLHPKGTAVEPIVHKIENGWAHARDTKQKVYNILRAGYKWIAIVEQLASVVNRPSQDITGLLCHFRHPSR
jgi:hypothetical protein